MNIRQVKEQYSIYGVLKILRHQPDDKKSKAHDLWFKSPFRPNEDVPSFHVNADHDIYKDFGDSEKGGDLIWFAQRYLQYKGQGSSVSDALKWFEELNSAPKTFSQYRGKAKQKKEPYKIISVKPIFSKTLFKYLDERKIPVSLAQMYLRQVYYQHIETNKKLYGLGFQTRVGSYDIRNALGFKTTIGKKEISIIKGRTDSQEIEIFEGVMDFLSYLVIEKRNAPKNDCIVLNSTNLHEQASSFILLNTYTKVMLWPDNDEAGRGLKTKIVQTFLNRCVSITDKSQLYKGFKDLNDWLKEIGGTPNHHTFLANSLSSGPTTFK